MPRTGEPRVLAACGQPLQEAYDLAMLDLDGVVYVGRQAVPGAAEHLHRARAAGTAWRPTYITPSRSSIARS